MYMYRDGYSEMERDLQKAESFFEECSLVNDVDELFNFAALFEHGEDVDVKKLCGCMLGCRCLPGSGLEEEIADLHKICMEAVSVPFEQTRRSGLRV